MIFTHVILQYRMWILSPPLRVALKISLHCWESEAAVAGDTCVIKNQNIFLSVFAGSATGDLVNDWAWIGRECREPSSLIQPSVTEKALYWALQESRRRLQLGVEQDKQEPHHSADEKINARCCRPFLCLVYAWPWADWRGEGLIM